MPVDAPQQDLRDQSTKDSSDSSSSSSSSSSPSPSPGEGTPKRPTESSDGDSKRQRLDGSSTAVSLDRQVSSVADSQQMGDQAPMARQVADIGLSSESETLGDVARRVEDFPYVGPAGGWMTAAEHEQEKPKRKTPYSNTYIGSHDVLPGCHVDPTIASMISIWKSDTDTLGKRHYFQSLVSDHSVRGIAQKGHRTEEACIAWCEEDNRLYVMLQAKHASSVE